MFDENNDIIEAGYAAIEPMNIYEGTWYGLLANTDVKDFKCSMPPKRDMCISR